MGTQKVAAAPAEIGMALSMASMPGLQTKLRQALAAEARARTPEGQIRTAVDEISALCRSIQIQGQPLENLYEAVFDEFDPTLSQYAPAQDAVGRSLLVHISEDPTISPETRREISERLTKILDLSGHKDDMGTLVSHANGRLASYRDGQNIAAEPRKPGL